MADALHWIGGTLIALGALWSIMGAAGVLRFPDVYTRLHALAKVDNIGLGFTTLGLLPRVDDPASGLKLILVWLLVLAASAATSFLVARRVRRRGIAHWERPQQ